MNNIIKPFTIIILALYMQSTFATQAKSDLKVHANINNTCNISMNNVAFGEITGLNKVTESLKVRCNKNTSVTMTAHSANNPEGYRGGFLTMDGKKVTQLGNANRLPGEGIRYHLWLDDVSTNNNYTVVYKNANLSHNFNSSGNNYDHLNFSMTLTVKTDQTFNLPIIFKIHQDWETQKYLFPAGDYYDYVTINAVY